MVIDARLIAIFISLLIILFSNQIARLIVNTFGFYPTVKLTAEDTKKIMDDVIFGDGGIICVCGHPLEEHDEQGCSVITVVSLPNDFAKTVSCKCTLTPADITERTIDG